MALLSLLPRLLLASFLNCFDIDVNSVDQPLEADQITATVLGLPLIDSRCSSRSQRSIQKTPWYQGRGKSNTENKDGASGSSATAQAEIKGRWRSSTASINSY